MRGLETRMKARLEEQRQLHVEHEQIAANLMKGQEMKDRHQAQWHVKREQENRSYSQTGVDLSFTPSLFGKTSLGAEQVAANLMRGLETEDRLQEQRQWHVRREQESRSYSRTGVDLPFTHSSFGKPSLGAEQVAADLMRGLEAKTRNHLEEQRKWQVKQEQESRSHSQIAVHMPSSLGKGACRGFTKVEGAWV